MKFSACLVALAATISFAQPLEQADNAVPVLVPIEETGLNSTELDKRASTVEFVVYPNDNCGSGGVVFFPSGNGAKGNFGTPQKSFYITKLDQNFHLTLYNGLDQSGPKNQLGQNYVGGCYVHPEAYRSGYLSYGLYHN